MKLRKSLVAVHNQTVWFVAGWDSQYLKCYQTRNKKKCVFRNNIT